MHYAIRHYSFDTVLCLNNLIQNASAAISLFTTLRCQYKKMNTVMRRTPYPSMIVMVVAIRKLLTIMNESQDPGIMMSNRNATNAAAVDFMKRFQYIKTEIECIRRSGDYVYSLARLGSLLSLLLPDRDQKLRLRLSMCQRNIYKSTQVKTQRRVVAHGPIVKERNWKYTTGTTYAM